MVEKLNKKRLLGMFVLASITGFVLEFILGWAIYFMTGQFLWIYPNSSLATTSWITLPIWGLAGLTFIAMYRLVKKYNIFKN